MNCKQNEPWPKNSAPKTSYITFNDDDDDDHNENWNWVASCTLGTYLANGSVSIFGCKEWRCARTWLAASMVVAHLYAARLIIQPSIWRFTCDGWKLTVARIFELQNNKFGIGIAAVTTATSVARCSTLYIYTLLELTATFLSNEWKLFVFAFSIFHLRIAIEIKCDQISNWKTHSLGTRYSTAV